MCQDIIEEVEELRTLVEKIRLTEERMIEEDQKCSAPKKSQELYSAKS